MSENVAAWWCVFFMSGVVSRSSRQRSPRRCGVVLVYAVLSASSPTAAQRRKRREDACRCGTCSNAWFGPCSWLEHARGRLMTLNYGPGRVGRLEVR
uniref:Secreted protein n=1 Tax=Ixodes ricinus TaxID=34613 RepID=A0A6B0U6V8_IXORI